MNTQTFPEWLFCGTFPNCYSYADTQREENGDYKTIARIYFNRLELKIFSTDAKYKNVIPLIKKEFEHLKGMDKIQISATGQTISIVK
jgi:hypothetical protein